MFGYCVPLPLGTMFPSTFLVVCLLVGGLSALTLGSIFYVHTPMKRQGVLAGGLVFMTHFFFLLYLRYSYATIVASMQHVIE